MHAYETSACGCLLNLSLAIIAPTHNRTVELEADVIAPIVAAPSVPQATDVLPQPAEVSPDPPVAAPPAIDPAAPRRRSRRHAQTEPVSYNENDPAPIDREIDLLESLPP